MPQADRHPTTIPDLIRDPFVAEAFRRAQEDLGSVFAIPAPKPRRLDGGAHVRLTAELEAV